MEVVTLDIINAMINCLRYADEEKLLFIKKSTVLSKFLGDYINGGKKSYQIFMAALLKNIGHIGNYGINDENMSPNDKKYKNYKSAEIIRVMPEIFAFQYDIADIILEIDERVDGSGYPAGKESILLEAQIIGVVEDYIKNPDIEKMMSSGKYDIAILKELEIIVNYDEVAVMLSNTYMLNEYFQDILAKYNVYKESIEGVEEEQFLSTVAAMIDFKHSYTAGHTKRVAAYSYAIAKEMDYTKEHLAEIRYAAYLHDIGKLGVDIGILDKPDKLTNDEFEKIKLHALYSYEILRDSPGLKKFSFGALHHERIDGKGYPFGMTGEELPEGAKIIAVADILDALTSNRSYRKPFTFKEAFELMELMTETALDAKVLEAAKRCFNI